jgi:hypothetical protein
VLSKAEVYSRLADNFVGLRFDWEQGNHYKDRFGFILGTGDQLLLDPSGKIIPHGQTNHEGKSTVVYGRHGCDTTGEVLDKISASHPKKSDELRLEWFLWPDKPTRRPGGRYPAPHNSIAGYARLPLAFVHGDIPAALRDSNFLRWHVRQFIWVRGETNGASRIAIKRVKDGLKPGVSTDLAAIDASGMTVRELGMALDRAWLDYMKYRPLVARGYLDNPHGGWMRSVKDQMLTEEQEIRIRALAGTLLPPGRNPGEKPPYL